MSEVAESAEGKGRWFETGYGEMVSEERMAECSPEVEGSRPENDRMSWQNPDKIDLILAQGSCDTIILRLSH